MGGLFSRNTKSEQNRRKKRRHHRQKNHKVEHKRKHEQKPRVPKPIVQEESVDTDVIPIEVDDPGEEREEKQSLSESESLDEFIKIELDDTDAYNEIILNEKKAAIKNEMYRSVIDRTEINSLDDLVELVSSLSRGKSLVVRHWIIFYWIATNIEYDAVNYFAKTYADQSAESVFRKRKGVCSGYANLYKFVCDRLSLTCEVVSGYSKGYGFDEVDKTNPEVDHAWNAVEIHNHWYLIESTWAAGVLNDEKQFEKKLNSYYFLAKPNEIIYHHLPVDEKWQLLRRPIKLDQFMRMVKLNETYFELNLELIQPKSKSSINFEKGEPFGLVLLKCPSDVRLSLKLKLENENVDGADRLLFDKSKNLYRCLFAPQRCGKHKAMIFGRRDTDKQDFYRSAIEFDFFVGKFRSATKSFPKCAENFDEFRVKIVRPEEKYLFEVDQEKKFVEIAFSASSSAEFLSALKTLDDEEVPFASEIFFDRQENLWRCKFAPNEAKFFSGFVFAKRKKSDENEFQFCFSVKIDGRNSRKFLSFPKIWQNFRDFRVEIVRPKRTAFLRLKSKNSPFAEFSFKSSSDAEFLAQILHRDEKQDANCVSLHFDKNQGLWICRVAPNFSSTFQVLILAKRKSDPGHFTSSFELELNAEEFSFKPFSLLQADQVFYDLQLEIMMENPRHKIVLEPNSSSVEIPLKTTKNLEFSLNFKDKKQKDVPNATIVVFDRENSVFKCFFAPNARSTFEATIFARENDQKNFCRVLRFEIIVEHSIRSPITYPKTFSAFQEFDLNIVSPKLSASPIWFEKFSFGEVLLQTPENVLLLAALTDEQGDVENGAFAQFNHQRNLWQCLFAPTNLGLNRLVIFARKLDDNSGNYQSALEFSLEIDELRQIRHFPTIFADFTRRKCQIKSPMTNRYHQNSSIEMEIFVPDAMDIAPCIDGRLQIDQVYTGENFCKNIKVANESLTMCAKFEESGFYKNLFEYKVR